MTPAPNDVRTVVGAALGTEVVRCERPGTGAVADTFLLWLSGSPSRAVCKFDGENVWTGHVVEPQVVDGIRTETDLPVPQVFASGSVSRSDDSSRWAVYEFRQGDPPTRDTLDAELLWQAGNRLGELHAAFPYTRCGEFISEGTELRVRSPTRRNLVASPLTASLGLSPIRPVLDHGDYQPSNLLVEAGEITAVLDWGNAQITDAGYALARAEIRFIDLLAVAENGKDARRQVFREGYASGAGGLPPAYERRFERYRLLWILQSGLNISAIATQPRGRRQLRRQCKRWFSRRFRA